MVNLRLSQSKFAELCGVSPAMISKYSRGGYIAFAGGLVDARESLARLNGHLDEGKRRAAIERLKDGGEAASTGEGLFSVIEGGRSGRDSALGAEDEPSSWRARRDKYAALQAEIAYYQQIGALVPVADVEAAIEDAIAIFWTETEQKMKIEAAEIASALGLNADQAGRLKEMMVRQTRDFRTRCAAAFRSAGKRATECGPGQTGAIAPT